MKILICNDDGIESKGLISIAKQLNKNNEVLVIAPDGNRSACSHSLSINNPIKILRADFDGITAYKTSGTPADCVKISQHLLNDFVPDICISGINKGHNIGSDTMYSGTLAVCIESAYFGVPAFAFSAFSHNDSDFNNLSIIAEKIIYELMPFTNKGDIWNINFPLLPCEDFKGKIVTSLGIHDYCDHFEKIDDETFFLKGYPKDVDKNDMRDCDITWLEKGYVTITPILFNKTDYKKIKEVSVCERL